MLLVNFYFHNQRLVNAYELELSPYGQRVYNRKHSEIVVHKVPRL